MTAIAIALILIAGGLMLYIGMSSMFSDHADNMDDEGGWK